MFDRDRRPEELPAFARQAEEAGVDDLWVVEDLAWAGAVSSAALALAATSRLRVGIGITPAPLRNAALLGMELATLARVFPGRLIAGVGHGVQEWMEQVGAASPAKLALLGETITVVRALVRGATANVEGRAVRVRDVRLVHPPAEAPPVVAGVMRPRSLELSGRVADGTILSEGQGPSAVAAALGHIAKGRAAATEERGHELAVFTYLFTADDPARVAAATATTVAETAEWLGIAPEEVYMASGDVATVAERVTGLWEAGTTTVVLRPLGDDPIGQIRTVLPALRAA
ncbi:LLM class flavin-dependent oxidoreductase [Streptomyces hoynatensis]|uniref:LLM class flavin-dependent oxidoreductase n=1 Tax=Streptomyces hoynatensis TaxID=1141874 RepID=A0A3A9Z395_9ACTN|nr:LLM class flavin-dependent oxidoreductase [Streptomyces hoynatensis]RKN41876.1 LLM class flavin-dependent oxidoreductase [Streptomyces hoynatensis]